ncbi:hypothetical protein NG796_21715 [Laspinema sp. A4]|uniref:hypothetical protein n=1 Tax=Laspinema sp. D2d TaxID=2953686 RepID=UPI0021BAB131|nr:hypothetical protein [Laspinema sp. D2d]MCT7985898.1 hypothetical protein [Laspinema sp. D2d]
MRESSIYQEIFAEGFEIGFKEGLEEARQEARQETIAEIARNLLLSGMSVEQIMNVTELTREQIEELTPRDSE